MTLTPEQKALIRQCSRDEDTYQQLLKLFDTVLQANTSSNHSKLLRTVIDSIPDRVYVKDLESRFVLVNRAMWAHHQMPDEQAMILGGNLRRELGIQ